MGELSSRYLGLVENTDIYFTILMTHLAQNYLYLIEYKVDQDFSCSQPQVKRKLVRRKIILTQSDPKDVDTAKINYMKFEINFIVEPKLLKKDSRFSPSKCLCHF